MEPDATRADRRWRRVRAVLGRRRAGRVVGAVAGAVIAVALASDASATVGPFDTTFSLRPSLGGDTLVRAAPLGTVVLDTHDAPVGLEVRVDELRLDEAERIAADPSVLGRIADDVTADARDALRTLAVRGLLVALLGGVLGALVSSARPASVVWGLATSLVLVAVTGGAAAATWRPDAVNEPRYTGLLVAAPRAVGDAEDLVARFDTYSAQLAELVGNVAALYRTGRGLPTLDTDGNTIRVLHVSDIHLNPQAFDLVATLVDQFDVDAVADSGDITDWGTDAEANVLSGISRARVPWVWVRGNHDSAGTQAAVASVPNAVVLDGEARDVAGLRFFGVGDPRYTPDKDQPTGKDVERDAAEAFAPRVATMLRRARPDVPDVLVVHDARIAARVSGLVPLVLAGHTHAPRRARIGTTTLLVQGSTGGAGLRGLQGDEPKPLTCAVLYFDGTTKRLVAYDQVTVRGLGQQGVEIERHTLPPRTPATSTTSTTSTPTSSTTSTPTTTPAP